MYHSKTLINELVSVLDALVSYEKFIFFLNDNFLFFLGHKLDLFLHCHSHLCMFRTNLLTTIKSYFEALKDAFYLTFHDI